MNRGNVEFLNESNYSSPTRIPRQPRSALARWVIARGFARDEAQANMILIVFIIVCILSIFFILTVSSNSNNFDSMTEEEMLKTTPPSGIMQ